MTVALINVSQETRGKLGGAGAAGALSLQEEAALRSSVELVLSGVAAHAKPAGLLVTTAQFSVAGGELTSNLKLRRKAIEAKYRDALDALLAQIDHATDAAIMVRHA